MRLCFIVPKCPERPAFAGGATASCLKTWHADKKQDRDALAKPLQSILQEVEGTPVVKTKVLHLFRSVQLSRLDSHADQLFLRVMKYFIR